MAQVKELEKKVAELEAQQAELEAQLAAKDKAIAAAKGTGKKISIPVAGTYTATWENPLVKGEMIKKTVKFKDGQPRVRLLSGIPVSSEAILKIANGKKASEKELKDFPELNAVTKEEAEKLMRHLIKIDAQVIEEVK